MKSKYYLVLFLAGILPVLALGGVYIWTLTQAPPPHKVSSSPAAQTTLQMIQTQVQTMANSMSNAILKTNEGMPGLAAHNTNEDLDNFMKTHPGVSGIAVFSMDGKLERSIPATPPLITDPAYGTSDEFQKAVQKVHENTGAAYLFYTRRLGYPAFVFAFPISSQSIAEAVLNLSTFFRGTDLKSGEIFLLEAGSGNYYYHSNPSQLETPFNPNQEAWLSKIQGALADKRSGSEMDSDKTAAAYAYLGFGKFGIVHEIPFSALQPAGTKSNAKSPLENLPELLQTPMSLAVLIAIGWVCIIGSLFFGAILAPLRKASAVVLNAAQGHGSLTAETARKFGNDDVGQMVQATSMLLQKLEQDKQQINQEKEEALRKARTQIEEKTKESLNQVTAAQQQAQSARNELNEKNQLLNDKLKELDALKGMSEGLRNQTEQAKGEIAKLKGQISTTETTQADLQKKATDAQAQLKNMEAKLLQAVATSSAIQVSQVRAAAIRTMSEELKTTLGIIKGYVSSALGASQGGINEKQQEFLGMVINRSARLEKFINDLVDIYQVEIEQEGAKYEEVSLSSEIEGLAFNFQAQAEVKNIKMKVEAKPGIPKIPIVRRRFNQLWNILYLQMIKDAPRGSSIPITVESIGETVKVTVQDPGLIVAPEGLPKLFDEFYDPKHPASPQLAGTGLKFALVKTILAAHGGGAVAEKGDPGTKLILTFPTKIKKPGSMPPSPAVTAPSSVGTVAAPVAPKAPSLTPPGMGIPKPAAAGAPSLTPGPSGVARPAASPGLLDSLISKVPPVTAPGLKPPAMGAPPVGAPTVPKPPAPGMPSPGLPAPGTGLPKPPMPGAPGAIPPSPGIGAPKPPMGMPPSPGIPAAPKPPMPGAPLGVPPSAPKPAPTPGLLDSLLDKKVPAPGAPSPGIPKPAAPSIGAPMASKPAAPPMPGMPSSGAPPAAPKVIPTAMKPAPAPGVLDLDHMDSFKVDAGAPPKPAAPPVGAPKPMAPPMPGAPPRPAPLPPPGVPPGGLNASKPIEKNIAKEGDGELIE